MVERQTQGSEFQALDPDFLTRTREELAQARLALKRIEADRDELEAVLSEVGQKWSDLEKKGGDVEQHIEALQVLLGERPYVDPEPPPSQPLFDVRPGQRFGFGFGEPTRNELREANANQVVALLREVGKPLHYRDIYRELETRERFQFLEVGGVDPAATLLSRFFKDPRLYRPQRGTYGLVEWQDREDEQAADAPANARSGLGDVPKARLRVRVALKHSLRPRPYGALNVAYEVLYAAGEPMHYQALASEMLETGWWTTTGSTPSRSVNAYLSKDIKDNGDESRFIRVGRGFYGLREPDAASEAVPEAITEGDEHE